MKKRKIQFIEELLTNWDNPDADKKRDDFCKQKTNSLKFHLSYLENNLNGIKSEENLDYSWRTYIQNLFLNHYNFIFELLTLKINFFFYKNKDKKNDENQEYNLHTKFLNLIKKNDNIFLIEKSIYVLSFILKDHWKDENNRIDLFINRYKTWTMFRNYISSAHAFNPFEHSITVDDINYDIFNEIKLMNFLIDDLSNNKICLEQINLYNKSFLNNIDYFKRSDQIIKFIITNMNVIRVIKNNIKVNKIEDLFTFDKKNSKKLQLIKNNNDLNSLYIYLILNVDDFYNNSEIIEYWIKEIHRLEEYEFLLKNFLYPAPHNNLSELTFFRISSDSARIFNFINLILQYSNINNQNKENFIGNLKNYFFSNNQIFSFFNSSLDERRENSYDFALASAFFRSNLIDYFLSNYFNTNMTNKKFNELFTFYKNIFLRNGGQHFGIPFNLWKLEEKINKKVLIKTGDYWSNFLEYFYFIIYKKNESEENAILYKRFYKKWNEPIYNYTRSFPLFCLLNETTIWLKNNIINNIDIVQIIEELKSTNVITIKYIESNHFKIDFFQFYLDVINSILSKYINLITVNTKLYWIKYQ